MKTIKYNPSTLEMDLTNALVALQKQIESHLQHNRITKIEPDLEKENPIITFHLTDNEGDKHELMVRIFQVPDKY
ncbi:MAG: hypothetical protein FJZ78_06715 [Bacteroidetes bacterium]|nr:hypothetical protein [Bacteroidota bacterium]